MHIDNATGLGDRHKEETRQEARPRDGTRSRAGTPQELGEKANLSKRGRGGRNALIHFVSPRASPEKLKEGKRAKRKPTQGQWRSNACSSASLAVSLSPAPPAPSFSSLLSAL